MRKLAPRTQAAYVRAVHKFAQFLGRSPDTATEEALRRFQLHLVDDGALPITLNAAIVGLNFLFDVTLGRPEAMARIQSVRVPKKLPVVLNKEEVTRLLACVSHVRHQRALSPAYATWLWVSDVVGLKVSDIDSQRMTLRVEQGKSRKDWYASFMYYSPPVSTKSCGGCKSTCHPNAAFSDPAEVRVLGNCYLDHRFLFK